MPTSLRVATDNTGQDAGPERIRPIGVSNFGNPKALELASDLIDDLMEWKAERLGWRQIDRAYLLSGPPGCGKTTLAAALAREAGLSFHATSYAQWQSSGEGNLGCVISAMVDVFQEAARHAPSLLFIDEIDSMRVRGATKDKGDDWNTYIVNAFLEQVDGAAQQEGVFLLAATNRPEALDPALVRPGRFERHLRIGLPDEAGRATIFRHYLHGNDFDDEAIRQLAILSQGSSGAAIESVVKAASRAARRGNQKVTFKSLVDAIDPLADKEDAYRYAVHEAGHVVALLATDIAETVTASLVGDKRARTNWTARHTEFTLDGIERLIVAALAGRAAEEIVLGSITTGSGGRDPESDLARATQLAIDAVSIEGYSQDGLLWTSDRAEIASCHPTRLMEAKAMLARGYERAKRIVAEGKPFLLALADALQTERALNHQAIMTIVDRFPPQSRGVRAGTKATSSPRQSTWRLAMKKSAPMMIAALFISELALPAQYTPSSLGGRVILWIMPPMEIGYPPPIDPHRAEKEKLGAMAEAYARLLSEQQSMHEKCTSLRDANSEIERACWQFANHAYQPRLDRLRDEIGYLETYLRNLERLL